MSDIAEHDSKKEWEGDSCEDWWVDLLIARNTVSVSDFLSDDCVWVGVEGGRWFSDVDLVKGGGGHHFS